MSTQNVEKEQKKRESITVKLTKTAVMVALMVLVSLFVKIPFYPVPLTLQTTIAILSGFVLGHMYGTLAMTIYMCMGLVGIPVFSGLPAGFAALFKPSFGYVLGFVATAFTVGICVKFVRLSFWRYLFIALLGVAVNYFIGLPYFMLIVQTIGIANIDGLSALSVTVIWTYNLIYLPKDILLAAIATSLTFKLLPFLHRDLK